MKAPLILVAAALAAACSASTPAANLVVQSESPALSVQVADSFTSLPALRFPIENLTNVERRVFVEADDRQRVSRMVVIQFERVQPGSDFRFLYPSTPPRRFGAQVYRSGAFAYDDIAAAERDPAREAGRTRAFLGDRGYTLPRYWRVGRLARVTDPDGLSEVIIFYFEDADEDFAGTAPPVDEDGDIVLAETDREAMLERLDRAVRVISG